MTAYNREKYIGEAIESVLASDFSNFELIIVDDCSTDHTLAITSQYVKKDNRVKVFKNERNLGDYPNRNKAASYASGNYLMYVDSDDTIFPWSINKVIDLLKQFPDASFSMRLFNKPVAPYCVSGSEAIRQHFFKVPALTIGPGGTVIKRKFFQEIGGYPVKYGPANDMYFNLKAACFTNMVMIPFEYMNYRRHEGQEINNRFSYLYNNYLYLRDALIELPLPLSDKEVKWLQKKNKRRLFVNLLKHYFQNHKFSDVRYVIQKTNFSFRDSLEAIFQV